MPVFEYKGFDAHGKPVSGLIDADTERDARRRLKGDGLYPSTLTEGTRATAQPGIREGRLGGRRIRPVDMSILTRQLATLVGAGLPMMECLNALVAQVENPRLKSVVADVRERVKEGSSLSDALTAHPKVFSRLYVSMVAAGEASGTLDGMLLRLADFSERQMALSGTVVAAVTYPIIMVVIGFGVLVMLMSFVVPRVTQVFEGMGRALPTPTVILIAISHVVSTWWWVLVVLAILAWQGLRRWAATEAGGLKIDQTMLALPVVGHLVRLVAISRFTRTLSTLLASGIPLLDALAITQSVVLNRVLSAAIEKARENIREGEGIASPLAASGVFPPMVTHMIAVGEATGEMEAMLVKVSEAYDREVSTSVASLTSILSPILILVMAGVVFAIVVAILLPIVEMSGIVN